MLAVVDWAGSRLAWRALGGCGVLTRRRARRARPRDTTVRAGRAGRIRVRGRRRRARATLALGLLDCLKDPDPVLRDQVAFEAWSAWLRGKKLDERRAARRSTRCCRVCARRTPRGSPRRSPR
jgi:hypothetical protein